MALYGLTVARQHQVGYTTQTERFLGMHS